MAPGTVEIKRIGLESLHEYVSVPMRLTVTSVLDVSDLPDGGFALRERPVEKHWVKDYAPEPPQEQAQELRRWLCPHNNAFFIARVDGRPVGGAAGIRHCPDAEYFCMTDGRTDVVVLSDIRVHPDHQRRGIGAQLLESVAGWARAQSARFLKVETQNVNVPACLFYQRAGARLGGIQRHHYREFPEEVMLLWYLEL
jgi:GNAT superfamily N-acetyltransferase